MSDIEKFPGPRSDNGTGEKRNTKPGPTGQLIDFGKVLEIKKILDASPITPNGGVYVEKFQHPGKSFTVLALTGHYSADAIRVTDSLLAEQRPTHFVIEGIWKDVPEVQHAKKQAEKLGVPTSDVIVSPYNHIVAELADVSTRDALRAIMINELSRYEEHPEFVLNHLAKAFNLSPTAINTTLFMLVNDLSRDSAGVIRENGATIGKLANVSNDLSWHKLQKLDLQGDVMVIAGGEHKIIFQKDYKPKRNFSDKELVDIEASIALYESGIKGMINPRSDEVSMLAVLRDEKLFSQIKDIEIQLLQNPENEVARQRLKNLLLPKYQTCFEQGNFAGAYDLAENLYNSGIEGSKELMAGALRANYNRFMELALKPEDEMLTSFNYQLAINSAKMMQDLDIEGSVDLIARAVRADYDYLMEKASKPEQDKFVSVNYQNAINRAKELQQLNIEGSRELTARAVRADYDFSMEMASKPENDNIASFKYQNAQDRAGELQELGIEGSRGLQIRAIRSHYDFLMEKATRPENDNLAILIYQEAIKRTMELQELELAESNELRITALRANYDHLMRYGSKPEHAYFATLIYKNAVDRAKELKDLDVEGADVLIKRAADLQSRTNKYSI